MNTMHIKMRSVILLIMGVFSCGINAMGESSSFNITSISVHPTNTLGVVNLALDTTVTPLTNVQAGPPQNVVDGDFGTVLWSYQEASSNTISFTVDIGREVSVGRLVHFVSQADNYLIETSSNGVDWASRHSETIDRNSSITRTHDVLGTYTARYFRYTGQSNKNTYVGVAEFQVFEMEPPHIGVSFPSLADQYYTLQRNDEFALGNWTNVVGQVGVSGNGGAVTLQDANLYSNRFYRVQESDTPLTTD